MKKIVKFFTYSLCMLLLTSCAFVTTTTVSTVAHEQELVEIIEVETIDVIDEFIFGYIDTTEFVLATNDEYCFKYNADIWNTINPLDLDENVFVDTNIILQNDVVEIIGSNITYLSNTTAYDYFELIEASIPSIPLTGVDIISTNISQVGDYCVALFETKAGFTKTDIENLIYNQVITHENVNAIGGLNNLDYKPILSQFILIIADDFKAYTFAGAFENNPNSSYFNSYYRNITLDAFDAIVQTISTEIKSFDK